MSDVQILAARLIPFAQSLSNWTATNPKPAQNEIVIETGSSPTTFKMKIGDGVTPYLSLPYYTGGGSAPPQSLQDTLNIGNTANDGGGNVGFMKLTSGLYYIMPIGYGYELYDVATNTLQCALEVLAGVPSLILKDSASAFYSVISSGAIGGNKTYFTPDESPSSTLDATFVTHKTKDTVQVGTGATNILLDKLGKITMGSVFIDGSGVNGFVRLYNAADGNQTKIWGVPFSGARSGDLNIYPPLSTGNRTASMLPSINSSPADANYVITDLGNSYHELSASITATRTITLPAGCTPGTTIIICNFFLTGGGPYNWHIAGGTVSDAAGNILTDFEKQKTTTIIFQGTNWRVLSTY